MTWESILPAALARQREGDFAASETVLLEGLLRLGPQSDALHLLGLARARQGHVSEGLALLVEALNLCGWTSVGYKKNLTLMATRMLHERAIEQSVTGISALPADDLQPSVAAASAASAEQTVAVVLVVNDALTDWRIGLESILAQSLLPDSVVVVKLDQSLVHLTVADLRAASVDGFRSINVDSDSVGASSASVAARASAGVRATSTTFVQLLMSGDQLASDCLKIMQAHCMAKRAPAGFSRVRFITDDGAIDELSDPFVFSAACAQSAIAARPSVALSVIRRDLSFGLGNLFLKRSVFDALNGLPEALDMCHWIYLLEALWFGDVVYVNTPLYSMQKKMPPLTGASANHSVLNVRLRDWWQRALADVASDGQCTALGIANQEAELMLAYLESHALTVTDYAHLPLIAARLTV